MYRENELQEISGQFQIYGEILHAEPCKIGHINETYTATYNQGGTNVRYIHQRINRNVFLNPEKVMENLSRVTRHIRGKLERSGTTDITRRVLILVPTRAGESFYAGKNGSFWRTFVYIENTKTFEAVESTGQAFEAGKAFGCFQYLLSDLPGNRLHDTIPYFHHTRKRFEAFQKAIQDDHANRAVEAQAEIEFCLAQEPIVDILLEALQRGEIAEHVTHNDTKFNNVMLDAETGEAMCVVDLDTVMPGLVLYDFGDMVRTTTSPTLEDERDLARVEMQMPMFQALARGYLEAAGPFLAPAEKAYLAFSGKLITYTLALRFLTDFLMGDIYFRVHRPGHNLDRTRTQIKLVQSIAAQEEAMQRFVDSV